MGNIGGGEGALEGGCEAGNDCITGNAAKGELNVDECRDSSCRMADNGASSCCSRFRAFGPRWSSSSEAHLLRD